MIEKFNVYILMNLELKKSCMQAISLSRHTVPGILRRLGLVVDEALLPF